MTGILNLLLGAGGVIKDTYFNLVSLLLPGNGTNGAQNNTFLDSSTNNFTITRNGNTTQGTFSPFSQTGWGNYFNGSSNLQLSSNADFQPGTGNFTIEAWVNFSANNSMIVAVFNQGCAFYVKSTGFLAFAQDSVAERLVASTAFPLNQWNHVAVVRSSTTLTIYQNGVSVGSVSNSDNLTGTTVTVGSGNALSQGSTGYISNFRFVKNQALFTGAFTPAIAPINSTAVGSTGAGVPTQSITGTVALLTCQSNRFVDNSPTPKTITTGGSPSVVAFSPFAPTAAYTTTAVGGSGYFDGTGDYLTVPSNAAFDLGTGAFTLEAWVYRTVSGSVNIFHGSSTGLILYTNSSNKAVVRLYGTADLLTSADDVAINTWTHVAVARSGTTLSMWLNGSRSSGGTVTNSSNFGQTGVIIGANDIFTGLYSGYMSSVRLVKGTAVYDPTQSSITVPTSPLTAVSGTSILLNFTNAGITDATAKNDLETVGNAQISTTVNTPFNGTNGSMYFDGAGTPADRLTGPNTQNTAFGTGNFVIEFFVYPTSSSATFRSLFDSRSGAVNTGISIWQNGTSIEIYGASQQFVASSVFTINSWQHVAVSRSSNTVRVYVGGTQRGSNYTNSNDMTDTRLVIGNDNSLAYPFVGYISNFRITKGNDRNYTGSTIPVPSAPFPVQ